MKVFVWNDPVRLGYGGSYAYAIAETAEQAREVILAGNMNGFGSGSSGPVPTGADIQREPDAVHDLPFGEVYWWQE